MENKITNISFELISTAGSAKAMALTAIKKAEMGEFSDARKILNEAREELTKVHKIHMDLISREAGGEKFELSLLFVHSQDHLTSAIVILDLAEHLINLYEKK